MINHLIFLIVFLIMYFIGMAINFVLILDIIREVIYNGNFKDILFRNDTKYNLYLVYLIDIMYLILLLLGSFFTTGILMYYIEEEK